VSYIITANAEFIDPCHRSRRSLGKQFHGGHAILYYIKLHVFLFPLGVSEVRSGFSYLRWPDCISVLNSEVAFCLKDLRTERVVMADGTKGCFIQLLQ
jgi:hypothetical protein